ncbi:hypothetical protein Poly59_48490 [Rubripirellula reticaptiva]|uniref:PepSY-associated TM helix n=1 Tax=Rubripirellula reticaptiva TaxID=2528013 RepID=A0A5C6EHR3_9BACT|nr:hypothetical protein Poly59_48490 [Rubripirellula reticaptiva]
MFPVASSSIESTPATGAAKPSSNPAAKPKRRVRRLLASWSRWLHIYLSMFGSAVVLFFSITGLTLNHSDWFFAEHATKISGTMPREWLNVDAPAPPGWDEYDFSHQIYRLEVVELLRSEHRLRGKVTDFLAFEDECEVTFQSPGYSATARINRSTGEYAVDVLSSDLVTVMNDLHKGRHSGEVWSWVIDVSAVIGTLVGLTGFVLIFFLKLRRRSGIALAVLGAAMTWYFYTLAVA